MSLALTHNRNSKPGSMKKLLFPTLLLAATTSYGALSPASVPQLANYTTWLGAFAIASDGTELNQPSPILGLPPAGPLGTNTWSGWQPNWSTGLVGPIVGQAGGTTTLEAVFLGETAGWWDDWGYRLDGVDYLLADGMQAVGGATRNFGDNTTFTLNPGQTLDFFVTGSAITSPDGVITVGNNGGKFYVYDKSLNTSYGAQPGTTNQSYYGTLITDNASNNLVYTVAGFEDINIRTGRSDADYNDVIFAFGNQTFTPFGPTVPEPSTYGLMGAAALLGLVGYRRFKKA